jgi:uncharacterized membrane protein
MASFGNQLRVIKTLHTVIWVFFAACVFAIPIFAWTAKYAYATALIGIVLLEVLVLLVNSWRCPLTGIAERYTDDRRDNFDIYLPEWLARHNKRIFGSIYVAGVLLTIIRWGGWWP